MKTRVCPKHFVHGCSIKLYSSKISNIINNFWDRLRKEHITSLREYQKIVQPNDNLPTINIGDIVIEHASIAYIMENGNY